MDLDPSIGGTSRLNLTRKADENSRELMPVAVQAKLKAVAVKVEAQADTAFDGHSSTFGRIIFVRERIAISLATARDREL